MRWSEATIPSNPASSSIGATVSASVACMNAVPDQNCIRPPVPVRGVAGDQGDHGAMTADELYWLACSSDFQSEDSRGGLRRCWVASCFIAPCPLVVGGLTGAPPEPQARSRPPGEAFRLSARPA